MGQTEVVKRLERPAPQLSETRAFGTGTVVLSAKRRGHLWVAEQRTAKPVTGRASGVVDIFTETAVIEPDGQLEDSGNTRLASLAEMINDRGIREVGGNFHLLYANDKFQGSSTTPGVYYRTAVVVEEGSPDYQFTPTAVDEVKPAFLAPLSMFTEASDHFAVRPLAREIVRGLLESGVVDTVYNLYDTGVRNPVFPEGFYEIENFQRQRDSKQDYIVPVRRRIAN